MVYICQNPNSINKKIDLTDLSVTYEYILHLDQMLKTNRHNERNSAREILSPNHIKGVT